MSPNARERAYERRRYEEWQAKLAQRKAARRRARRVSLTILAAVVVVLVIGGTFFLVSQKNGNDTSTAAAASPSASAAPSTAATASVAPTQAPGGCKPSTIPAVTSPKQYSTVPAKTLAQNKTWTLTLVTTCGTVTASLDGAKAPQAVSSTIFLSRNGFYDNSPCPRLTATAKSATSTNLYVLQCGTPTGSTSDSPGYSYGPLENVPADGIYAAGDIAMARSSDPNTQGSQFFIVYKETSLPADATNGGYSVIGHVTKGLDVVTKLAKTGENGAADGSDGKPNTPISIISAKVTAG